MDARLYGTATDFGSVARWVYRRDPVLFTCELTALRALRNPPDGVLLSVTDGDCAVGAAVQVADDALMVGGLPAAMAKTAANLAAKLVCDEAIQLLGGYGFSREYPVERTYRDIRGLCIGAGTVEIQRNFIGSQVLRGATSTSPGWRKPIL